LTIDPKALRRQCERDARSHLLKLRQAYLESAQSPGSLEGVLSAAASGLVVLARTLLRLGGADSGGNAETVFRRVHSRFGIGTEALWKAWQLKHGATRVAGAGIDLLYRGVLEEFASLARVVNDLPA
jgi:hypothetical protein